MKQQVPDLEQASRCRFRERFQRDRRRFLVTSAAALGTAALAGDLHSAQATQNEEWVDAHVHVWTPDLEKYPLATGYSRKSMQPASFTPQQLMVHARPSGVGRVVLIQMSYYGFDNSYMLDVIRNQPKTYRGVAVIDENDDPARVMKKMKKQGVSGFRIQPGKRRAGDWLKGNGMQAMWSTAADEGQSMCHLINPEFLPSIDRMCSRYPKTSVVIDHFARIGIDGKIREKDLANLCRLARHPQVTVKVSAYYALGKKQAPYRDLGSMIRRLLGEFGAERLMWASDCPFQVGGGHAYAPSINLIKSGLEFLSSEQKSWILKKTAEKVFFQPV